MEKKRERKGFLELVKEGFVIDKKVVSTYFYDILFYLSAVFGFFLFLYLLKIAVFGLEQVDYSRILTNNIDIASRNLEILEGVFSKMILAILAYLLFCLFSFSFFKGLIWGKIFDKKMTGKSYLKSLAINFIYELIFVFSLVYFIVIAKQSLILIPVIAVLIHFNSLSYFFFNRENKIFKTLWKSIKFTFASFLGYIPHYLIILFFLYIFLIISGKIFNFIFKGGVFGSAAYFLSVIFFFSVLRNYFAKFMGNIESES